MASWGAGYLHCRKGQLDKAIAALERFVGQCRDWDLPMLSPIAASLLGYTYALLGRASDAIPLLDKAMEQGLESRSPFASFGTRMFYMAWLGEGFLLVGRNNEATRLARRAFDVAREHKGRGCEALALRLRGEIVLRRDSPDMEEADASYHQAMALAEELGMRPLVAHCHLGLGRLYRRTGKREQAQEHLTTATTMYRDMGMTYWLERAEAEVRTLA
jgi:tetratricopeptide (TPR) repeat protein